MNTKFKKFSAAFMALAMTAGFAAGCTKTPDNTENTTTTAATSETEASKESEQPTTDAPKETEPAVSETTKEPSAFFSKYTLWGGPSQAGRKIDAEINEKSILIWKDMVPDDAYDEETDISYRIYISGVCVDIVDPTKNKAGAELKSDLKRLIDSAVKSGDLKKSENDKYPVLLKAETSDYFDTYAAWFGEVTYATKAKAKKLGSVSAEIDNDGNLKWKGYKNADAYEIYINEYCVVVLSGKKSISLNKQIDFMIKAGFIKKADTYNIRLVAFYDFKEKPLAAWEKTYAYASNEVEGGTLKSIENLTLKDGVMTWDPCAGTDHYFVEIFIGGKRVDEDFVDKNQYDVNNRIATELNEDLDLKNATYSFRVSAVEMSASDGFGVYESDKVTNAVGYIEDYKLTKAPNPLSVTGKEATVSSSKLKAKKQTLSSGKVFNGLSTRRGGLIITKLSGDKNISVNKSSGKVTIKKDGLKKGETYEVKVSIKAKGNIGYEPSEVKEVTFTIKVT